MAEVEPKAYQGHAFYAPDMPLTRHHSGIGIAIGITAFPPSLIGSRVLRFWMFQGVKKNARATCQAINIVAFDA